MLTHISMTGQQLEMPTEVQWRYYHFEFDEYLKEVAVKLATRMMQCLH